MVIDWNAHPELLTRIKLQAKVDNDVEDELIKGYVESALFHVEQHCDVELVEADPSEPNQLLVTPDIWQAVYLLVAHWYATREAVALGTIATTIPLGVERLLWYRKRF
ncbi:head-tail connector protein [Pseudomonas aeruginosa]|nr:head-tail connector protein [Pseudomonas aeruginosa]